MPIASGFAAGGGAIGPSSIGIAIKGILADARAKGLLKAQSEFQTAGANELDILKTNRAEENMNKPSSVFIPGTSAETDRIVDSVQGPGGEATPLTRGMTIKSAASDREDPTLAILRGLGIIPEKGGEVTTPNTVPAAAPAQTPTDLESGQQTFASDGAGNRIVSTDGGVTWRDVKTGALVQ